VTYRYDALGRRIMKESSAHVPFNPDAGSGWQELEQKRRNEHYGYGLTLYGWDGDTLAWESRANGGGRTTHYVYEPGSFVPLAQATHTGPVKLHAQPVYGAHYDINEDPLWVQAQEPSAFTTVAYYQCDHLGTPQELTDAHGGIAWCAQYRAWGEAKEVISEAARRAGINNPIRFQGQYHDHETDLHYNRHRYYDPQTGRFISKDPIGLGGGIDVYLYAPNPATWIDPLGLSGKPLSGSTRVNRIGGNTVDQLRPKEPEKRLNPPGISVLQGCCPCDIAQQMRNAFPKATGLLKATETVASGTADAVRRAGFDVIDDPTNKFPNHARIIHPDGLNGFSDENLTRLSEALGTTTECPR
jgi:RHS repeat-associated protein